MSRSRASLLFAMLVGCGPPPGVDWSHYHPEVKERIDAMAENRDCRGLQAEFDVAYSNDGSQRARTGSGNGPLMGYIDSKMRTADCFE